MTKKRVVITGAGIVSCIGNDLATVEASLRAGKSGIKAVEKFKELGLRSQVGGAPEIDIEARIDRKQLRFMGDAAAYAQIALEDAIQQAGLTPEQVSHPRTGLIMGSGGGSPANQIEAADTLRDKGIRRVGPYQVTRCMSSTVSACLATNFKVKGINYSITSACSTSAHCIGAAADPDPRRALRRLRLAPDPARHGFAARSGGRTGTDPVDSSTEGCRAHLRPPAAARCRTPSGVWLTRRAGGSERFTKR